MNTPQQVFTDIYARKVWGDGSGGGSVHSGPYIDFVNKAIEKYRPKRILDIGCGDLVVASQFKLMGAEYIGWDAATFDVVVARMQGSATVHMGVDALTEPFPEGVDMVLCKEVMQHLPNEDVLSLLERMNDIAVVILCNSFSGDKLNEDIEVGGFRPLDLFLSPFRPTMTGYRFGKLFGPQLQYAIHIKP